MKNTLKDQLHTIKFLLILLYTVMLVACGGSGGDSSSSSIDELPAPTNLKVTVGDGVINLTWDWVDIEGRNRVPNYHIYLSKVTGVSIEDHDEVFTAIQKHYPLQLTNGTTYYIVLTAFTSGESDESVEVSIDYKIGFSLSGTVSGLTGPLILQNNNDTPFTITSDGIFVLDNTFQDGDDYALTIETQPGEQTCEIMNGSGTFSGANITDINITCSTIHALKITSLEFLELGGRKGHGGLVELQSAPIPGPGILEIKTTDSLASISVDFVTTAGAEENYVIDHASYATGNISTWHIEPKVPTGEFVIKVSGLDSNSRKYKYTSSTFLPKTFSASLSSKKPILTSGPQKFEVNIKNHGSEELTLNLTGSNDHNYEMRGSFPTTVPGNGEVIVTLTVTIPDNVSTGNLNFTLHLTDTLSGKGRITFKSEFTIVSNGIPLYVDEPRIGSALEPCRSDDELFIVYIDGDSDFNVESVDVNSIRLNSGNTVIESPSDYPLSISNFTSLYGIPVQYKCGQTFPSGNLDMKLTYLVESLRALKAITGPELIPLTLHFDAEHSSGDIINYALFTTITIE